ncbi:MAG: translation initiation factor IF-3 [Clostridia bacterium]|nr:translation initiation factor IF-3 [Clostridia bacterium]MDD4375323.1 translation initiation factor IF-3 [Clostridia bacterium]
MNIKQDFLINEQIKASQVQVISENGDKLGQMKTKEAIDMAYAENKDLVMVGSNSNPPVCKILDYNKFKFEMSKKAKEAKKKQKTVEIKEIRLSANIEQHDLEVKARNANKFLKAGDKVKVSLRFRGREVTFSNKGKEIINKFVTMIEDGQMEKEPKLEGRFLNVVISPNK